MSLANRYVPAGVDEAEWRRQRDALGLAAVTHDGVTRDVKRDARDGKRGASRVTSDGAADFTGEFVKAVVGPLIEEMEALKRRVSLLEARQAVAAPIERKPASDKKAAAAARAKAYRERQKAAQA